MKQFTEYRLTITDPTTNLKKEFLWPVIDRNAWAFCVKSEIGEIWFEAKHATFGSSHDKVCVDQLDHYLNWLKFQLQNDINFFVEVTKTNGNILADSKKISFSLLYTAHQWSDESNTWVFDGLKCKDIFIPKSLIHESLNGKMLAPFWYLKKFISAGGRDTLSVIKKVRLSDISTLLINTTSFAHHH